MEDSCSAPTYISQKDLQHECCSIKNDIDTGCTTDYATVVNKMIALSVVVASMLMFWWHTWCVIENPLLKDCDVPWCTLLLLIILSSLCVVVEIIIIAHDSTISFDDIDAIFLLQGDVDGIYGFSKPLALLSHSLVYHTGNLVIMTNALLAEYSPMQHKVIVLLKGALTMQTAALVQKRWLLNYECDVWIIYASKLVTCKAREDANKFMQKETSDVTQHAS